MKAYCTRCCTYANLIIYTHPSNKKQHVCYLCHRILARKAEVSQLTGELKCAREYIKKLEHAVVYQGRENKKLRDELAGMCKHGKAHIAELQEKLRDALRWFNVERKAYYAEVRAHNKTKWLISDLRQQLELAKIHKPKSYPVIDD